MAMGFAARAKKIIGQSSIVLEVIDCRFPAETRNHAMEKKVLEEGKKLVIVANKRDLVESESAEKLAQELRKQFPVVFVSTKERKGKKSLLRAIALAGKGKKVVAVIGYPNTGKSSIINLLKGKKAVLTSITAGFTKGESLVRINSEVSLIDSPGVIPIGERDEFKLFLVGAKNPQGVDDQELAAIKLIQLLESSRPNAIRKRYGVEAGNAEDALEAIALKRKKLLKGGKPDTTAAARAVLEDWAKGKLA